MPKDHSQRESIKQAALDLPLHSAIHITCPYCEATHERSMRVYRDEVGLHAKCYRAKCGEYRFLPSIPSPDYLYRTKRSRFEPKYFTKELSDPPGEVLQYIYDMWEITKSEVQYNHIKYNAERNLLYMPIRDIRGYEIGGQTKALDPKWTGPKAVSYFHNDVVKAHFVWPKGSRSTTKVVVVEDILSAIKVGRVLPAVALLSCDMTADVANHLASIFKEMILMLDPDALTKSLVIKRKYSLYFMNFSIIQLSKDPKDIPFDELKEVLNEQCI